MRKSCGLAIIFISIASILLAAAQTDWQVEKTLPIGGQGGWDYLTVVSPMHRLYVPRGTHALVIDSQSEKVIGDIPGQETAHGVAIVPEAGRGFISDGGGKGAIIVFDLKTNTPLGKINAQPDADGIIFDPVSGKVLVVSGDKGVLMSFKPDVDLKKGVIDPPIELGGSPEFLAVDKAGRIYVNLMDKNEVAVVSLASRKVVARWPVAPGGEPVGMSIDPANGLLFIGCRKPAKLIVMSTESGKVLANLPIGEGVDATVFDRGEAFASCRDGSLVVVRQVSPGKFAIIQTVKTPAGARTMAMDRTTQKLYLPTAEFDAEMAGGARRPALKPGSFMIVVVARPQQ